MPNRSSIISSSIGNILEWYDFGLFTIFSSLFSRLFFPNENPHVALIATIGLFTIGFLCRPLGALIFGYLGDKYGRASTLRFSVLMIAAPTLLIGMLPTYHQASLLAPFLLTLIRIWQGISIGGEYSGNLIYLAEMAPREHRALFTSFASMGSNIGILLATLVGIIITHFLSTSTLEGGGWRVPYLLSGLFCLFIYAYRMKLKETAVFTRLQSEHLIPKNPIAFVFRSNKWELLRTLGLVCMGSTFYYFCFVYLPVFMSESLGFSLQTISNVMFLLILTMIFMVPLAGMICDKIGRRKMLLFNAILISFIIIPGFYFLHTSYFIQCIFILFLFTFASAFEQGTTPIALIENFPPPARYTGVALGYNLGNGFLGGTVPFVCQSLLLLFPQTLAPAFYITFCALITLLTVYYFVPETRQVSLGLNLTTADGYSE